MLSRMSTHSGRRRLGRPLAVRHLGVPALPSRCPQPQPFGAVAWARSSVILACCLWVTALQAEDWPMFRGNPALTGVAAGTLPAKLTLRWSFKTAGAVKSSAAVSQGRVFIGSDDSNLYALALADGKPLWTFKTGGEVESSPLVLEGRVFVGSSDGCLYALAAATGKLLWKYQTGDKILGAPNWTGPATAPLINTPLQGGATQGNGTSNRFNGFPESGKTVETVQHSASAATPTPLKRGVNERGQSRLEPPVQSGAPGNLRLLVGSYDFKLHCLDAATGHSNWVYETGNYINGSPAVAGGRAAFAGCDGLVHVISLANGQQEKEIEAGAYVPGSPALMDNCAYLGHYENQFLCIDIVAGRKVWTFKDRPFPYVGTPAVTADRVLFGGQDKLLHCVKRTDGTPLWSFATRGKIDSSPVVCGDNVIVGSDDGRLYRVSLDHGKELWSYDLGQPIKSSPAVAEGKVLIGSDDGNLYCFGAP